MIGGDFVGVGDRDFFWELGVWLRDYAGVWSVDIPALGGLAELLEGGVHGGQGDTDDERRDADADHEGDLLQAWGGSDDVAGFEVLAGVAGIGSGDADGPADGDGEGSVGRGGPAFDEEDGGGGHQRSNSHAGDGRGGAADEGRRSWS